MYFIQQFNKPSSLCFLIYGINITYDYDKDKNITSLIHKGPQGVINSFAYTYDNNGNQLSKTENGVVTAYSYDKLGRLQTAGNNTYTYDNAGNRKSWSGSHGMTTYNYDSRNRLVTVTDPLKGSIVYGYDNNGNQLTASNGTIYTYDGFNRLKTIAMPNGSKTFNEYDALGLRTATIENGIRHDFVTDRGNIITEVNAKNELVARNLRGLGLIAKEDKAGSLNYYLHNAHGDVTNLVNEEGKVLNRYEYDAFGNTTSYTEQVINRYRYAGEHFDNLTGQYYLRARYYNPLDGRFTQEDTYRGDGLNLYAYVRNNPIMYVDPSGYVKCPTNTKQGTGNGSATYPAGSYYNPGAFNQETGNSDTIDLSKLKPEDVTRTIAEYLIENPAALYATQQGWFKDLFWAAGFNQDKDSKGVYHARQDALQQYGGYNFIYDIIFDYATSMKAQPFEFIYNSQDYRLWAWKGDYLNLGAGAELGLYKRLSVLESQTDHWLVDTKLALPMTLTLKDNKGNLISSYNPSEPQWWITAFNSNKQDVNATDLRVTYTVDFSGNKENKGMFDAFYKQWYGQDARWTFDKKNYTATLKF